MKVLVLGANGMAGHVIVKYLRLQGHEVTTMARLNADHCFNVETTQSVIDYFKRCANDYDYIINAIGLLVANSIQRPDRAIVINSWFPQYLASVTANSSVRVIHLSTDCVFDGSMGPYIETDQHSETNFYGRSKSLGEINNDKDVTFRMSIIGPELKDGTGLLHWFLHKSDSTVPGYSNCFWNGITTLQLAKSIDIYLKNPVVTGIYHLVNNDISISKLNLLKLFNEIYHCNKTIVETTSEKPVNKILIDTKQTIDFAIPDYTQQLIELKDYI